MRVRNNSVTFTEYIVSRKHQTVGGRVCSYITLTQVSMKNEINNNLDIYL